MSSKYQPPWIRLSGDLQDTAANIGLGICAEVYEKPQLETRRLSGGNLFNSALSAPLREI